MTEATSVKDLEKHQKALQEILAERKVVFYKSQKALNDAKAKFSEFMNKYGRVLEMMKED